MLKPKETGMCGEHSKSPSIVLGAPTTLVKLSIALKKSANTAFVFQ